jgi:hypothetical protein
MVSDTVREPSVSKRPKAGKLAEVEAMILGSFLDFAERSVDEFVRFLFHCGIDKDDIDLAGGDIPSAILEHYRRPDGTYDIDAVAHDWFRWPPIAARLKELKREKRRQELAHIAMIGQR